MMQRLFLGFAVAMLIVGLGSGSERERTYRAYCRNAAHDRGIWFTNAYSSMGPAWMYARKHNEAYPGHDATVANLIDARR